MRAKYKKDNSPTKLCVSQGILIPYINDGKIHKIKIRTENDKYKQKYRFIEASSSDPMVWQGNTDAFMIVESELDGILLHQEAGNLIGIAALGAAQLKPDADTTELLKKAGVILVSLDSDEAGAMSAYDWWLKHFDNAKRWPVLIKIKIDS